MHWYWVNLDCQVLVILGSDCTIPTGTLKNSFLEIINEWKCFFKSFCWPLKPLHPLSCITRWLCALWSQPLHGFSFINGSSAYDTHVIKIFCILSFLVHIDSSSSRNILKSYYDSICNNFLHSSCCKLPTQTMLPRQVTLEEKNSPTHGLYWPSFLSIPYCCYPHQLGLFSTVYLHHSAMKIL